MSGENAFMDDTLDRSDGMARVMPYAIAVTGAIALAAAIAAGAAVYNHYNPKPETKVTARENIRDIGGQR